MTLLLISGPTASGKSDLALKLGAELDGEIISVDSVQIYRGCDIGSAKPSPDEQRQIPHHLIDILEPNEPWNVAEFIDRTESALNQVSSRGKQPILCGGTTMYLSAFFGRFDKLPTTSEEIRRSLSNFDNSALYQQLQGVDSESAKRIAPDDRKRIVRSLEVYLSSGQTLSAHRGQTLAPRARALMIVLIPARDRLHQRIQERTEKMLASGLVEETKSLIERYGLNIRALETIGYNEAVDFIQGKMPENNLIESIAIATRQFAKRQMTFWRNEPKKRGWIVRPDENEPAISRGGEGQISSKRGGALIPFRTFEINFPNLVDRIRLRLKQPLAHSEVWYLAC